MNTQEEICDNIFLSMLDNPLWLILKKELSGKQKKYLRNKHRYSSEEKLQLASIIKEEINDKAKRKQTAKLVRRASKSRP